MTIDLVNKDEEILAEKQDLANEIALNNVREDIKEQFPGVNFRETLEFMEQVKRGKHRCNTCNRYTRQTDISMIDAKFKKHVEIHDTIYFFRIPGDPNEKLEDSKCYCIKGVGQAYEKVKTIIPIPKKSSCTDWTLHLEIIRYFGYLTKKLVRKRDLEEKQETMKTQKILEYENAKKITDIFEAELETEKRPRGRPSTDPSKKTFYEE